MKIALVCPYDIAHPGGVANHVLQFARFVRKVGHEVDIIAPSSVKNFDGVISAGKPIPIPMQGGTVARVTFSFWNFPKIRRQILTKNYDILHIHEPGVLALGIVVLACADPNISAIVTTSHSNSPHNLLIRAYSKIAKAAQMNRLTKKIRARIAVSEAAKNFISKYFPGEYAIVPNGVDVRRFSPTVRPIEKSADGAINYLDGKVNILFVGRLGKNEKRKGLKYLVSAFNTLHDRCPETRLIIAGPGKPDRETRVIVKSGNSKGIVFAGNVPLKVLPRYYAASHIFCSPATHGESFGMVLVEAMASGRPVIAFDIDGYREVVLEDTNKSNSAAGRVSGFAQTGAGILVEPKNEIALAAALETLVHDKGMRREMGAKGRQRALKHYRWEIVTQKVLGIYEKAIAAQAAMKI